jgi:D-psicose/D-tagatose/L-ribulose 3-epimerase
MKVGINLLLWTGAPSFEKDGPILDKLKNWGYDCFEICTGGLTAEDVRGFGKKADELGLEPCTLDVYVCTEMDVISPDPAMRKKAVEFLKSGIIKTAELGGKVFSGPFFQGLCNTTQVGPTADEWKRAVDSLRECAGLAKEKGVKLAAEPLNRFEMYLLNTCDQAYRFCTDVGMDNFGILADTHHANIEEPDIAESWARVVDRINSVHISENNRGIPGSGHAITPAVFETLKKGGYDGNLVIEAFNANVPEILPLLRLWRPFVEDVDEIAVKGLEFIKKHI